MTQLVKGELVVQGGLVVQDGLAITLPPFIRLIRPRPRPKRKRLPAAVAGGSPASGPPRATCRPSATSRPLIAKTCISPFLPAAADDDMGIGAKVMLGR